MNTLMTLSIALQVIDRQAVVIVIIGYMIVFLVLAIMYLVFKFVLPFIFKIKLYRRAAKEGRALDESEKHVLSGEVNAAIATAIYLYFDEVHDVESNVITIRKVSRSYSPWNSKIYNMRNLQR